MAVNIQSSAELTLQNFRALVYGPPGQGKTFSCITASENCPADFTHVIQKLPPRLVEINLADLLWFAFDTGALDGFLEQKLIVPTLDLSKIGGSTFTAALKEATDIAKAEVGAGRTKTIVVDTVSALDEIALMYYKEKGFEKWDLYGNLKIAHMRFAMALKALPCNVIFLCHAKAQMEAADAVQANKQKAGGFGSIIPNITGDSLNHYRRDSSFIFPLLKGKENGIEGRWFYPDTQKGFEAKSRFILNPVEPADWRKIIGKVKQK